MLMFLLIAAAPHKHDLAQAVEALLAGDQGASKRLEELHEARPWDDDVAFWLARARLDGQRCEESRALLVGREGKAWPEGAFRALEGLAAACVRDDEAALSLLAEARESLSEGEPLLAEAHAAAGLLYAEKGWEDQAARALRAAGGSPSVLEPWLVERLGGPRLGLDSASCERAFFIEVEQRWFLLRPTGLALPHELPEQPEAEQCGGQAYALGPEGLISGGEVVQHPIGGLSELDLACFAERLLVLRMGPDGSLVQELEGEGLDQQGQLLLGIDGSGADLLAVVLVEGRRQIWWKHGEYPLAPLLQTPLEVTDARWPD